MAYSPLKLLFPILRFYEDEFHEDKFWKVFYNPLAPFAKGDWLRLRRAMTYFI